VFALSKDARDQSVSYASWQGAWHEKREPAWKALFSEYTVFFPECSLLIGEK